MLVPENQPLFRAAQDIHDDTCCSRLPSFQGRPHHGDQQEQRQGWGKQRLRHFDWKWHYLEHSSTDFPGITYQSTLRRRPNCFNLLHQLHLAQAMGKVASLEDHDFCSCHQLLISLALLISLLANAGVDQGYWTGRGLPNRRTRKWCCHQFASTCRSPHCQNIIWVGQESLLNCQCWFPEVVSFSKAGLELKLEWNFVFESAAEEVHHDEVFDSRTNQGGFVQCSVYQWLWTVRGMGEAAVQLTRSRVAYVQTNGIRLPSNTWEQT